MEFVGGLPYLEEKEYFIFYFKKVIHVGEVQLLEANSTYLNPRFLI